MLDIETSPHTINNDKNLWIVHWGDPGELYIECVANWVADHDIFSTQSLHKDKCCPVVCNENGEHVKAWTTK
jgi:hypothetical protein